MTFEQKAKNDDETGNLEAVITELKPFTTYAVYIQAYTLSSASHSAMTQVETFTTNPWGKFIYSDAVSSITFISIILRSGFYWLWH